MPTAHSWTEPASRSGRLRALVDGVADVRSLLAFRRSGMSEASGRRVRIGGGLVVGLTVMSVVMPAYLRDPLRAEHAQDLVAVLPSIYLGFVLLAAFGAIGSGG